MKERKSKFICDTCNKEFYITVIPKLCPLCGGQNIHRGSKKSRDTAKRYIEELNSIIPNSCWVWLVNRLERTER